MLQRHLAQHRPTLLDRACRSLVELASTMAALKERRIDRVCLKETIGAALPAGRNVSHVLGTLADVECRPGAGHGKDPLTSPAQAKRPGRKPLDQAKAAAVELVTAGLSPAAAARRLGLGRSTVYREVRWAGIKRGA
jgi:DNA invertase Pin-like site-specific DNA recombinase